MDYYLWDICKQKKTMTWWRGKNKRLIASMARLPLTEACDVFDAMIASMGPSSEPPIEAATANAVITIDETDRITGAPIELAVGAMDSEAVATAGEGPTMVGRRDEVAIFFAAEGGTFGFSL